MPEIFPFYASTAGAVFLC